jgi:hypothetical protein
MMLSIAGDIEESTDLEAYLNFETPRSLAGIVPKNTRHLL